MGDFDVFCSLTQTMTEEHRVAIGFHLLRLTGDKKMPHLQDNRQLGVVSTENLTLPGLPKARAVKLKKLRDKLRMCSTRSEAAEVLTGLKKEAKEVGKEKIAAYLANVEPWKAKSWKYVSKAAKTQLQGCDELSEKEAKLLSYHLHLSKSLLQSVKMSSKPKLGKMQKKINQRNKKISKIKAQKEAGAESSVGTLQSKKLKKKKVKKVDQVGENEDNTVTTPKKKGKKVKTVKNVGSENKDDEMNGDADSDTD